MKNSLTESLKNANIATNKQQKTITRLEKALEDTKNELKASQVRMATSYYNLNPCRTILILFHYGDF